MNKKTSKNGFHPISKVAGFFKKKSDVDAVVFVHGLRGHYQKTWGDFPVLLESDPDMPRIDILLWGYKTGFLRPLVDDTRTIGRQLVSSLRVQLNADNAIHAVGHSMGGLILLQGIVGEMVDQRAQNHPCTAISFVSLFASPVSGSMAGAVVNNTVGNFPVIRKALNKQIRSLAKGSYCENLLIQVNHRVYKPTGNDSSMRKIPIRMIMGTKDAAVSEADRNMTFATYRDPAPLEYNFGHGAIKLPESNDDDRYKALGNDVKQTLVRSFRKLCEQATIGSVDERDEAEIEIEKRYGEVFRVRYEEAVGAISSYVALYRFYRKMINTRGATEERPAFDIANRVLMRMRRSGLF